MLRFCKTKVAEKELYGPKKPIKIWDDHVDNIVISKLVETKNNSKYLTGYFDEVLILSKMSGYAKIFKDKVEDKNKTC